MTPPRRQQQQQQQLVMRDVFGRPPPMPAFGSNPGVGRPPGSSTDGLPVAVSGSPVRSPSLGASPISVRDSSGKGSPISVRDSSGNGSPISVRGSSGKGSPQSWPSPPPQTGSRARSVSRRGTRIETNEPETRTPGGKSGATKTGGRPPSSKKQT